MWSAVQGRHPPYRASKEDVFGSHSPSLSLPPKKETESVLLQGKTRVGTCNDRERKMAFDRVGYSLGWWYMNAAATATKKTLSHTRKTSAKTEATKVTNGSSLSTIFLLVLHQTVHGTRSRDQAISPVYAALCLLFIFLLFCLKFCFTFRWMKIATKKLSCITNDDRVALER